METQKDIEKTSKLFWINLEASEKVSLAQPILDKIILNPQLANFHDPVLSKLHDSRWSGHFVRDTLYEITRMYSTQHPDNMPEQVQKFVSEANKFLYGGKN